MDGSDLVFVSLLDIQAIKHTSISRTLRAVPNTMYPMLRYWSGSLPNHAFRTGRRRQKTSSGPLRARHDWESLMESLMTRPSQGKSNAQQRLIHVSCALVTATTQLNCCHQEHTVGTLTAMLTSLMPTAFQPPRASTASSPIVYPLRRSFQFSISIASRHRTTVSRKRALK